LCSIALTLALLAGGAARAATAGGFAGHWEVTRVVESAPEGAPWSQEIKYPKSMTLELRDGRLAGRYTDQWGDSDEFELVAVVNRGRDLLLVNGGLGTKQPQSFAPVHHVKLVDGKLHAIVTARDRLFEWYAERR
jgi:hypothetical protein